MHETAILDQMVEEQNGYIRLIDAQNKGLPKYAVLEYIRQKEMERIAPSVYITEDAWEDRLYLLQIRNLYSFYSFYKTYPEIFQTSSGKSEGLLSWSHYAVLLQVKDGINWTIKKFAGI